MSSGADPAGGRFSGVSAVDGMLFHVGTRWAWFMHRMGDNVGSGA